MAIYALVIIALALSVVKAKQMFLNRPRAGQIASVSQPVTLAVLPFQGISGSSADNNVALNITEELTADFRSVRGLHVVAQGSATPPPDVAANPQHGPQPVYSGKLLRGTAGRDGNRIQIAVQLVDASSGISVWSKTFERSGPDLLETERDIASAIASEVENSLRTGSPEA